MEQVLRKTQIQKLAPQTMQSLQLLSMPFFALKSYLSSIVLDNPCLEPCFDAIETSPPEYDYPEEAGAEEKGILEQAGLGVSEYRDRIYSHDECSLYDHLFAQVDICGFSEWEEETALFFVSNISTTGYLETDIETAVAAVGGDRAEIERVLSVIQGFTPAGVGARNLSECLCLQVDPEKENYDLLIRVINDDLTALATRKFEYLARKHKISRPRIQEMLDYIKSLDPKPGRSFSKARFTPYIIPDATVIQVGNRLEFWINGSADKLLSFNPDYMKDVSDEEASAFLKQKRAEALSLIGSINMRNRVLRLLIRYLTVEQKEYFTDGASALRPMTQKKAAEDLGLDPSTISRCIRDKYIETSLGCIALSSFFSSGLDGGSSAGVRELIAAMIAMEDKTAPLSDMAISEKLAEKGVRISRRTASKYRTQLGLGGQSERKRY